MPPTFKKLLSMTQLVETLVDFGLAMMIIAWCLWAFHESLNQQSVVWLDKSAEILPILFEIQGIQIKFKNKSVLENLNEESVFAKPFNNIRKYLKKYSNIKN